MTGRFVVTVDAEQDIAKYLPNSYLGVDEGLPFLLDVFQGLGIRASVLVQGLVCDRFPDTVREIQAKGHTVGCHGYFHVPYGERPRRDVRGDVATARESFRRVTGREPTIFRAVEFSLDSHLVRVLEDHGFRIDSSALNNYRRSRLWGFARRALGPIPSEPYLLTRGSRPAGRGMMTEVPVTENPRFLGAPLGVGYLNLRGAEATKAASSQVGASYCTFLIHPWEVVDFPADLRGLPEWVRALCRRDPESLEGFLGWAKDTMGITRLEDLVPVAPATG